MNAENRKEFLDTNVLVYAHDRANPEKQIRSIALLADLIERRAAGISLQVLAEFFVTVTRKLERNVSTEEAERLVDDLSALETHEPRSSDISAAIDIHRRYSVSFWDAMIIRSASVLDCHVLWSEDLSHGQRYGDLVVRNPFTADLSGSR